MSSTATCDRFEAEGLLQLERGEPLDPHFESCDACQRSREAYDALRDRLGAMPEVSAPRGWDQEVWQTIAAREALTATKSETPEADDLESAVVVSMGSRRPEPRRRMVGGVLGGLAAAALLVLMLRPGTTPPKVAFTSVLESTSTAELRGGEARPGDTLVLRAELGSFDKFELRIYRDESELWLRCSEEPPCVLRNGILEGSIVLDARGVYQPVLFLSSEPLPPGGAGLDPDAGEAIASGARVETVPATTVR